MALSVPLVNKSIVARIGTFMFAISLMALVSMIGSGIIAHNTQGDASAINLSGSLRMMSFKILAESNNIHNFSSANSRPNIDTSQLRHDMQDFEQRLYNKILQDVAPADGDQNLYQHYQSLKQKWQTLVKPIVMQRIHFPNQRHDLATHIGPFVSDIDDLVLLLEKSTESKIKLLSLVQGISLIITIGIILVAMLDITNNVVRPLKMLVSLARDASSGNLLGRIHHDSEDELGLLSDTYNQMAEELQKIYADLEQRVEQKTAQLQKTNETLQLLYTSHQSLHRSEDICARMMPVMQQLETITRFGPISLTLRDPNKQVFRELNTQCRARPNTCLEIDCTRCLVTHALPTEMRLLTLPIQAQDTYFGEFTASYPETEQPSQEEVKLLETIVENLATSLSLERKVIQQQHLSLIEERSVIARELHDSLAQSLSYLKIQVSRLSTLRSRQASEEQLDEVVVELKNCLNNAYRQLRELLSTFRLKLDASGLEPALKSAVEEFSERLGFVIDFQYRIHHINLSANEEIHLLQIVREALANVMKHAQATAVQVSLSCQKNTVTVAVCDNGVGLSDLDNVTNHYGLAIMQDRTTILGGDFNIDNLDTGGVRVSVSFTVK